MAVNICFLTRALWDAVLVKCVGWGLFFLCLSKCFFYFSKECLCYCEQKTVVVPLPGSAKAGNGSSCRGAGDTQDLQASFGDGHALSLVFSRDAQVYHVANLSLSYNLSDNATFPESSSKGIKRMTLPSAMQHICNCILVFDCLK